MLSLFASLGSIDTIVEKSNLRRCHEYIMKHYSKMALCGAAFIQENGKMAAATTGFRLSADDFQGIQFALRNNPVEKISFRGVTYCIKSINDSSLVSFNGRRYVIVSKAAGVYIITLCESRQKSSGVAKWIGKVAKRLGNRNKK